MQTDDLGVVLAQRAQPGADLPVEHAERDVLGELGPRHPDRLRRPARAPLVVAVPAPVVPGTTTVVGETARPPPIVTTEAPPLAAEALATRPTIRAKAPTLPATEALDAALARAARPEPLAGTTLTLTAWSTGPCAVTAPIAVPAPLTGTRTATGTVAATLEARLTITAGPRSSSASELAPRRTTGTVGPTAATLKPAGPLVPALTARAALAPAELPVATVTERPALEPGAPGPGVPPATLIEPATGPTTPRVAVAERTRATSIAAPEGSSTALTATEATARSPTAVVTPARRPSTPAVTRLVRPIAATRAPAESAAVVARLERPRAPVVGPAGTATPIPVLTAGEPATASTPIPAPETTLAAALLAVAKATTATVAGTTETAPRAPALATHVAVAETPAAPVLTTARATKATATALVPATKAADATLGPTAAAPLLGPAGTATLVTPAVALAPTRPVAIASRPVATPRRALAPRRASTADVAPAATVTGGPDTASVTRTPSAVGTERATARAPGAATVVPAGGRSRTRSAAEAGPTIRRTPTGRVARTVPGRPAGEPGGRSGSTPVITAGTASCTGNARNPCAAPGIRSSDPGPARSAAPLAVEPTAGGVTDSVACVTHRWSISSSDTCASSSHPRTRHPHRGIHGARAGTLTLLTMCR
ncbi:hypothetical protein, partial [Cellulomonas denverensis]